MHMHCSDTGVFLLRHIVSPPVKIELAVVCRPEVTMPPRMCIRCNRGQTSAGVVVLVLSVACVVAGLLHADVDHNELMDVADDQRKAPPPSSSSSAAWSFDSIGWMRNENIIKYLTKQHARIRLDTSAAAGGNACYVVVVVVLTTSGKSLIVSSVPRLWLVADSVAPEKSILIGAINECSNVIRFMSLLHIITFSTMTASTSEQRYVSTMHYLTATRRQANIQRFSCEHSSA